MPRDFTVVPGFWLFKKKTLNPIVSVASLTTSHKSEKKKKTKRFWSLTTRLDVPEIWVSCETIFTSRTARLFFKSIYLWKKEKHRQVHITTSLLYSSTFRRFGNEKKPATKCFHLAAAGGTVTRDKTKDALVTIPQVTARRDWPHIKWRVLEKSPSNFSCLHYRSLLRSPF